MELELLLHLAVNGVVMGSVYTLIAVGFALIFSTTKLFHFAHGGVYALAAYTLYFAKDTLGQGLVVGLILAVIVAVAVGCGIELGVYRPLRRLGATPLVILIGSLGCMIFLQNFIAMAFGTETKTLVPGVVSESYRLGAVSVTPLQAITVLSAVVLFALLQLYLTKTKTGKAIRAVANNAGMAQIVGISSDRIFLLTFVIGSAIAVPAAFLVSLHTGLNPSMGMLAILMAAIAVIVGGVGSLPGAALGALLLGLAENVGVWKIPSEWQSSIAFGILLIFIVFRPTGFFGHKLYKAEI